MSECEKLVSVSLVVLIVKGHKRKELIFIDSVELALFNNTERYTRPGRELTLTFDYRKLCSATVYKILCML